MQYAFVTVATTVTINKYLSFQKKLRSYKTIHKITKSLTQKNNKMWKRNYINLDNQGSSNCEPTQNDPNLKH